MPSMRTLPLNPRAPAPPKPGGSGKPLASAAKAASPASPAARVAGEDRSERVARAGGFHESSYELKHGLDINESEWPSDVTQPGKL